MGSAGHGVFLPRMTAPAPDVPLPRRGHGPEGVLPLGLGMAAREHLHGAPGQGVAVEDDVAPGCEAAGAGPLSRTRESEQETRQGPAQRAGTCGSCRPMRHAWTLLANMACDAVISGRYDERQARPGTGMCPGFRQLGHHELSPLWNGWMGHLLLNFFIPK